MKIKYRSALESAIAYLVATQKIIDSQEVVPRLKVSKTQFSEYRNGKVPMSANFIRKFWECFGVDLGQFKEENAYAWPEIKNPPGEEGKQISVNEPDANYDAGVQTPLASVSMLGTLVEFLFRIHRGEYDGRTPEEVAEQFRREYTAAILDRAKNTQTEKGKKGKASVQK